MAKQPDLSLYISIKESAKETKKCPCAGMENVYFSYIDNLFEMGFGLT